MQPTVNPVAELLAGKYRENKEKLNHTCTTFISATAWGAATRDNGHVCLNYACVIVWICVRSFSDESCDCKLSCVNVTFFSTSLFETLCSSLRWVANYPCSITPNLSFTVSSYLSELCFLLFLYKLSVLNYCNKSSLIPLVCASSFGTVKSLTVNLHCCLTNFPLQ